jgi:hypothetical protein
MQRVHIKGEKEPRLVTSRYYEVLKEKGELLELKEEKSSIETKEDKKATRRKTK